VQRGDEVQDFANDQFFGGVEVGRHGRVIAVVRPQETAAPGRGQRVLELGQRT
jgi:hypothetical protein